MRFSPLLDALGVFGATKIILILWLFKPLTLTGLFACLAIFFLSAVLLAIGVPGIGKKKSVAILALALLGSHHRPTTSLWPTIMSQNKKHGEEDKGRKYFKSKGLEEKGSE
jgi:hypothetical protein